MAEPVYSAARVKTAEALFGEFGVTRRDLAEYLGLIESGENDEAIERFVDEYLIHYVDRYNLTMQDYLRQSEEGEFSRADLALITASVGILGWNLTEGLKTNVSQFLEVAAPEIFAEAGITSAKVQTAILEATLSEFESLVQGAMSETQTTVISHIRAMQRDMIIRNQQLRNMDIIGGVLRKEQEAFYNGLRKKFPEYYQAMEEGKILRSRKFGPGGQMVRSYKLGEYVDMSVTTTLLNVDRTAVEVVAGIDGVPLVEYYKRDTRKVQSEREICKSILGRKINGRSVLAITEAASAKYGVPTVADARASGAMGPNCRHSFRILPPAFYKGLAA